jgi:hypothetical protein
MFEFQVFGSKSSKDLDVMVFVDDIPQKPHLCHQLESELNIWIKDFTKTGKEVNSNLAVIEGGIISKVFKGIQCEVNNSLIRTYDLHQQYFPLKVKSPIERDVDLKILRTCRVLLSFISRTEYRSIVKPALSSKFSDKVSALYQCDISKLKGFTDKNVSQEDIFKVYAFQIGQTLSLIDGVELYTKEEISMAYPELEKFIARKFDGDLVTLEKWKVIFLDKIKNLTLKSEYEYKYGEF